MNRVKWTVLRLAAAAAAALPAIRACADTQVVDVAVERIDASARRIVVGVVAKAGGNIVAVDPEKVAARFEATSDLRDWNGAAKLTPDVKDRDTDANGKMTFAVTLGDGTAPSAFLRITK